MDNEFRRPIIVPFLKWAGGKRWFTEKYSYLLPQKYKRYIEPFLGSGAVFFHLNPDNAFLSDSNAELVNTYKQIKVNWKKVLNALRRHHRLHDTSYYYEERVREHRSNPERAAQFIYLNRTCWNGLYRVNLKGDFNVPIGTKTSVCLDTDNFELTARSLQTAKIKALSFEEAIKQARKDDFLFVDPPYVTRHNFNGFVKYNDKIFSWEDQEKLAESVKQAAGRGVKILVTNADHNCIHKLYDGVGKSRRVRRHSVLAADSRNRGITTEIAILINYDAQISKTRETT